MIELLWTKIPSTQIPILAVVALIGIWFLLRSKSTKLASNSDLDARIGGGRPIVLDFFSNI